MAKKISIVVPCFNEEKALPIFFKTIIPYLEKLNLEYELVFVDDGSKDNTASIIKDLAKENAFIKYVIFTRNFGKEAAMYAGLTKSTGDYVAIMDADLQDPPAKLEEMYNALINEGYDCVATRRVTRKGEPKIRSMFARMFYRIINRWSQVEFVDGARDFRLMTRQFVNSVLEIKEYNRFSKGIFSFVGYKTKWLEYENVKRCAGESKWSFRKLFVYALEGIIEFSNKPLHLISCLAIFLNLAGIASLVVFLVLHLDLMLTIFVPLATILASYIIGSIAIVAMYLSKTLSEVRNRPIYLTKEEN